MTALGRISEMDRARLMRWAAFRVPGRARAEVRVYVAVRGQDVVVYEQRPLRDPKGGWNSRRVARLRYREDGWLIDGADRDGRWYPRDEIPACGSLPAALTVLDDPRHAFWG